MVAAFSFPYRLYGGATRPDAISGLQQAFRTALINLYGAAPPEVQRELGLTSGYRSIARQKELWDASDKTGHTVAYPGHSEHNFGLAADLAGFGLSQGGPQVSQATKDWVYANAPKFGLNFPMKYEPWHVQLGSVARGPDLAAPAPAPAQAEPAGSTSTASFNPSSTSGIYTPQLESFIRNEATKRGIDPDQAMRVARSEGFGAKTWGSSIRRPDGSYEQSFGPFQLYMGGGLGNNFMRTTGEDPRDPSTVQDQIRFALDNARLNGWGAWHGWKGDAWAGIDKTAPFTPTSYAGASAPAGDVGGLARGSIMAGQQNAATTTNAPPASGEPQTTPLTTFEQQSRKLGGLMGELQRTAQATDQPMMQLRQPSAGNMGGTSLASIIQQYLQSQMRGPALSPTGGPVITPPGGSILG